MKPAPFDYACPSTIDEALGLLAGHGASARVLAGGQSLLPEMALRRLRPDLLVDINRVAELSTRTTTGEGTRLGATVRQAAVLRTGSGTGLLDAALPWVGNPGTRSRGTVVGSLCFADPAAELPAVLLATGGSLEVRSAAGRRSVAAAELYRGPGRTAPGADELAVAATFPLDTDDTRSAWLEFGRRPGDLPLVGVGVVTRVRDGVVAAVRVACAGVHDVPWSVPVPDLGGAGDRGLAREVAELASRECDPADDDRTTAAHRRVLVRTLVRRALEQVLRQDTEVTRVA
ncbi:FAD binding domain-containing protein [Pseudonocardia kujensis]|uniref:FAD binding domain-containing protein n=1 Tax=Pseudonocardia kujensis TaxID=1128675 RepID=UPI001E5EEE47|nr:FAD binding domain-containing protein [Pseudonocardia kujensis]MCE0761454.1 FAD binding domain-containing protein [Pseudonocardia kujensis]